MRHQSSTLRWGSKVQDTATTAALWIAISLLIMWFISVLLHYFVALTAPPWKRAAWTAGIAYLVTSLAVTFVTAGNPAPWAPLIALPGGLIIFWYWHRAFRRAWIDSADDLPEGMSEANDDWRIAVLRLLAIFALVVGVTALRFLMWNML